MRWFPENPVRCFPSLLALTILTACSSPSELAQNPPLQTDSSAAEQTVDRTSSTATTDPSPSGDQPVANSSQSSQAKSELDAAPVAEAAAPASQTEERDTVQKPVAQTPKPIDPVRDLAPHYNSSQRMAGFSADGRHYLYLESSRDTGAGIPKSRMQVIDLSSNTCLNQGCIETSYGEPDAGVSLADAEQSLLQRTWSLRKEMGLTPPTAGNVLPILSRSRTADGTEVVTVQLKDGDRPVQLRLQQRRSSNGSAMQLEVVYNGQRRSLSSLNHYRDWVLDYSIREVRQSPGGTGLAILLTATKPTFEGNLKTTLVQGLDL